MHTLVTILAVLALLALLVLLGGCGSERTTVANQEPAPLFELEQLAGGTVGLDELRGQVVALRFWADWCPFCRHEMRELEPVYQQLREQGLEILAVNVGQDQGRVQRFVDRVGYSYPTLLDPDSAIARRYGVIAIPVTFFIDRQGIVRGRILGESDAATFERIALPLLTRPEPAPEQASGPSWRGVAPVGGTPCVHPCRLDGSIPAADTRPPAPRLASTTQASR